MYQVYNQQRPGRPRWALGSSAILLLLTVVLAWGLIQYKSRSESIPLEPFSARGVRGGLPAGWQPIALETAPAGTVAAVAEGGMPARRAFVFTHALYDGDDLREVSIRAATRFGEQLILTFALPGDVRVTAPAASEAAAIAGLPAWTVHFKGYSPFGEFSVLVRAASSPSGRHVGAAILGFQTRTRADRDLLDQISSRIELATFKSVADPRAAMQAAGISFDLPATAIILESAWDGFPRLRLASRDAGSPWQVSIARAPKIGRRTAQHLARDAALDASHQASLEQDPEPVTLGGRQAYRLEAASTGGPSVLIWTTDVDEGTTLLAVGRSLGHRSDALDAVCRLILQEAQVEPYDRLVNVAKAQDAARARIRRAVSEGLGVFWNTLADTHHIFSSEGNKDQRDVCSYGRERVDGKLWWQIHRRIELVESSRPRPMLIQDELWRLQEKGAGLRYEYTTYRLDGQKERSYTEVRAPGAGQVNRALKILDGGTRQGSVEVGDTYANERVILAIGGELSQLTESDPMIFSTTEAFPEDVVNWVLRPRGPQVLPWSTRGEKAPAVCLQRDYDPDPILIYYDADGVMIGFAFGENYWSRLEASTGTPGD